MSGGGDGTLIHHGIASIPCENGMGDELMSAAHVIWSRRAAFDVIGREGGQKGSGRGLCKHRPEAARQLPFASTTIIDPGRQRQSNSKQPHPHFSSLSRIPPTWTTWAPLIPFFINRAWGLAFWPDGHHAPRGRLLRTRTEDEATRTNDPASERRRKGLRRRQ